MDECGEDEDGGGEEDEARLSAPVESILMGLLSFRGGDPPFLGLLAAVMDTTGCCCDGGSGGNVVVSASLSPGEVRLMLRMAAAAALDS